MIRRTAAALCTAALLSLTACSSAGVGAGESESGASSSASTATATGGVATTGSSYFPVQVGNVWVYRVDQGGTSPTLAATDTSRITSVTAGADGSTVTVEHTLHVADGSHQDVVSTTVLLVRPDGSVAASPQTLTSGDYAVALRAVTMVLPGVAQLASGQPVVTTTDLAVTAGSASHDQNIKVTVTAKGPSSVTVPAGTFDATLVAHVFELAPSVLPIPITISATSYLVKGIGLVKSTIPAILGMSGDTTITLLSFTKG